MKVVKFGGSSLANSRQFEKVKRIIEEDPARKIVVVSACGKIDSSEHKVTDLLYLCEAQEKYGMDCEPILQMIKEKHREIIEDLHLSFDIEQMIEEIRKIIQKHQSQDLLVSRGEYIAARLMAEYLEAEFVDATDVISLRYDGSFDLDKTRERFEPYLRSRKRVVVPGFYGVLPNGIIKVMSRGGSDITGAILANVTDAQVYENWTDVSGMLVSDPRIIDQPKRIDIITYEELREMSYMGANVLHEDAVFPVIQKNIPIHICNTNEPENPGTYIVRQTEEESPTAITGVTGKRGFIAISAGKPHASSEIGFLKKALQIIENYHISITSVVTGVDTFSFVIEAQEAGNSLYAIAEAFRNELGCEEVKIVENISLVCIVGRGMRSRLGMSGQIFGELGNKQINIRTISQGPNEISIIVGVDDKDFKDAIRTVYERFIEKGERK